MAGIVKSVQNISITITAGNTSATGTINSVNTATTALNHCGQTTTKSSGAAPAYLFTGVTLTNSTTVTAHLGAASTDDVIVDVAVIEFSTAAVKSINSTPIAVTNAASNTATISSVATANSVVFWGGCTSTDTADAMEVITRVALTNSTTVTATCGITNGGTTTQYYTVVEFYSGILNSSVQTGVINFSSGTSATATITSVTTSQTMLLYNGWSYGSAFNNFSYWPRLTLTNGTTVTVKNTSGGLTNFDIAFSVLEFKSSDIKSINRAETAIASSSASNTATITAVDTTLTAMNLLQFTEGSPQQALTASAKATLTNSTTVTVSRGASDLTTDTVSWEAIEFVKASDNGNFFLVM